MIFTQYLIFLFALPLVLASAIPKAHLATRDNIQSGETYTITNVRTGTAVDLSGGDNRSSKQQRVVTMSNSLKLLFEFFS